VHVIEGGTNAAKSADVPIERGKGSISIERQVRIGAGALVVVGCIAGLVVHAGFFAVPLFVGSGLVFAGVTDVCGMGMMLAKMPWNR
jgi:predicted branched-subunit amino acid permease